MFDGHMLTRCQTLFLAELDASRCVQCQWQEWGSQQSILHGPGVSSGCKSDLHRVLLPLWPEVQVMQQMPAGADDLLAETWEACGQPKAMLILFHAWDLASYAWASPATNTMLLTRVISCLCPECPDRWMTKPSCKSCSTSWLGLHPTVWDHHRSLHKASMVYLSAPGEGHHV
jgi:hypothetical protein